MAKITNPSKLLASSKSSAITKIGKSNILAKTSPLSKGLLAKKQSSAIVQSKDASDANNKLVNIDKFLKSDLIVSQKKTEVKRKGKEKQDFDEAEKKLETPQSKKFKIPGFNLPSLGFMDRVKRFIFFTALGWLVPKIIEFLPKLEGFAKIVGGIYNFAEGLFGNLFNGFMSLVKFGGDLKDKTLGFIASAKAGVGGNYQKEFEKLEKQFNTFANASIIAGLVGLDMGLAGLDEFNKQKKKGQKPIVGKPGEKPKPSGKPKVTTGRGGEKPSGKPKVTTGKGGKVPGWWNRIFKGPFAKLKGPLSKFAGAAVPGLGAVVGAADAKARFAVGDKIGGALASVSAALDAATVASALTGVGIPVAGILGSISIGIDVILLIRDILSIIPFIPKNLLGFSRGGKVVKRYQGGGTTRGGRPVGGPKRRSITPTRKKPPRVTIPKTQPGKDVGGEKKVKDFYAKPEDPSKKYTASAGGWLANLGKERRDLSAFDTLKKMSGTLKSDETLAKGILGVMSSGIDMALGQKPDKKVFKSFFDSIGYIADTLASQRASKSMSSLRSQIGAFAEGGTIPSRGLRGTYGDANTGDMLAKLIGPTIDQRVNEAIQSIEKQLQMKGAGGAGGGPPGAAPAPGAAPGDGDAPGARFRDGSNAQIEADLLEYFTALYGKNAAIGIVANIRRESGYRTSTPDNPRFEGMVQWSRNDRWPKFVKWAESKGLDPYSRNAQAQYVAVELKQLGTDKRISQAKTAEEASSIFYNEFERAAYSRPVVGARNYDPNNPHERKNKGFIQEISGRNPDIGKRKDDVLVKPPSPGGLNQPNSKGTKSDYVGSTNVVDTGYKDASGRRILLNPGAAQAFKSMISAGMPFRSGDVTSVYRDESEYLRLISQGYKPAANSKHNYGEGADIQGAMGSWIKKNGSQYGWHYSPYPGQSHEGHFEWKGSVQAQPQAQKPPGQSPKPRQQATSSQQSIIQALPKKGAIPITVKGQTYYFEAKPDGTYEVWKPGFMGSRQPINISGSKYAPIKKAIQEKINSMYRTGSAQPSSHAKPGQQPSPTGNIIRSFKVDDFTYTEKKGGVYTQNGKPISKQLFDGVLKNHPSLRQQNMQAGGLVSPSKPNRAIPNSFASYETPGGGMIIAIQPMIIERQVPVSGGGGKMIAFPSLGSVNSNTNNLQSLSRG